MKKILVLWSGGFDSTYLVQYLLEQGNQVETAYVRVHNNLGKTDRELDARLRMMEVLKTKFGNRIVDLGERAGFDSRNSKHIFLPQAPWWLTSLLTICDDHDEVAIGYVCQDESCSYLDDYLAVWEAYKGLFHGDLPKLTFPLKKYRKWYLNDYMDEELKELCWCCENEDYADTHNRHCGTCTPCKHNHEAGLLVKHPKGGMIPKKKKYLSL